MRITVVSLCVLLAGCGADTDKILEENRTRTEQEHAKVEREIELEQKKLDAKRQSREAAYKMKKAEMSLRHELNKK